MKTTPKKTDRVTATGNLPLSPLATRHSSLSPRRSSLITHHSSLLSVGRESSRAASASLRLCGESLAAAFTLIELLVVIAIIAILAAMLLPVLSVAQTHARKVQAQLDANNIVNAIEQYHSTYSRFPVSGYVQNSGWTNVTYGFIYNNAAGTQWPPSPIPANYEPSNTEVISILMDITNFPGTTTATVNTNSQYNPNQTTLLAPKMTGDTSSPGVGTDLNFRDPWGNPYIITIDLNEDNKCEDPFYSMPAVSSSTGVTGGSGLNGLILEPDGNYGFHGNEMVWSMGPYGPYAHSPSTFDTTKLATDGSNKNHILSWK